MNDNMPSNSNKSREMTASSAPTRRVEAVAHGQKTKKSFFRSALDTLFSNEEGTKIDFRKDIVEPAVSNVIFDTITSVTDAIVDSFASALFPGTRYQRRRGSRLGYTDYGRRYRDGDSRVTISRGSEDRDRPYRREISREGRTVFDFSEIVFDDPKQTAKENLEDAKRVLTILQDLLEVDRYGNVTVADFYNASGISSTPQDRKWGWDSLAGAHPESIGGKGYILVMPKPKYLD